MLSTTRKAWRIGKQFELVNGAITAQNTERDEIKRILKIVKGLSFAIWVLYDNFGILHSHKIMQFKDIASIKKKSAQFWFLGLLASLSCSIYEYRWNSIRMDQELKINKPLPGKGLEGNDFAKNPVKALNAERNKLLQDLATTSLDICIPATSLGYLNYGDSLPGLCGTITSAVAIWKLINKYNK